jgi:hypothetical protein
MPNLLTIEVNITNEIIVIKTQAINVRMNPNLECKYGNKINIGNVGITYQKV